jgi:TonB family protein
MKWHRLSLLLLLGLALVPGTALPDDHPPQGNFEDVLNAQFHDAVLVLLHPSGEESLQFNADGTPAKPQPPGPWTIFGGVHIRKIRVQPDRLRLEGQRVFYYFKTKLAAFDFNLLKNQKGAPCQPFVDIEIKLDQPLGSASEAQAILAKVFAFSKKDFVDSLPDLWRAYATTNFDLDSARPGALRFAVEEPAPHKKKPLEDNTPAGISSPAQPDNPSQAEASAAAGIFHVGNGVSAPRAIHTPEPEYSQAARYEKYQGMMAVSAIIDKEGNVQKIELLRPLGLGLDEQAAVQMKTWRFDPAKHAGEPVAVALNIEIRFNLY